MSYGIQPLLIVAALVVLAACSTPKPAGRVETAPQQAENLNAPVAVFKRKVVLHGADFAFDEAALSRSAQEILSGDIVELKANPSLRVRIEGHSDSIGVASYNRRLSEQRALSVKAYLVERGVAADRIATVGFGEDYPVASNDSEAGRVSNRRVEVKIIE